MFVSMHVRACVRAFVRACVREHERVCAMFLFMRARMHACMFVNYRVSMRVC